MEASSRPCTSSVSTRRTGSHGGLRFVALAWRVLLPSASGAPVNGFAAAATKHTPPARTSGPARARGLGRRFRLRHAPPGPRPRATEVAPGFSVHALPRPKAAPERADTPPADTTTHTSPKDRPQPPPQNRPSSHQAPVAQERVQSGAPGAARKCEEEGGGLGRKRWAVYVTGAPPTAARDLVPPKGQATEGVGRGRRALRAERPAGADRRTDAVMGARA
jgi:hypothetical protein